MFEGLTTSSVLQQGGEVSHLLLKIDTSFEPKMKYYAVDSDAVDRHFAQSKSRFYYCS